MLTLNLFSFHISDFDNLLRRVLNIINTNENSRISLNKETAFLNIVTQHDDIINRICRSFSHNDQDLDDLRQDSLINIWRGLESFKNNSELRTWLYRIVINTCVSAYRKKKNARTLPMINIPDDVMYCQNDFETLQWLKLALESLDPLNHAIMIMWLDDFSYDEISQVIGINRNTIATRIKRSKEKLKNIITNKKF